MAVVVMTVPMVVVTVAVRFGLAHRRVGMLRTAEALFAVEHHKIHAERVQRRDEHARDHREVREARSRQMRVLDGFDDRI